MQKRTRALDIPPKVKDMVWERDGGRCIICGDHAAMPNAHYISRAQGGRGIPENIVTLCLRCHDAYDHTDARAWYKARIRRYLMQQYPDWQENKLIYQKGMG